jgi:hypothetical protein
VRRGSAWWRLRGEFSLVEMCDAYSLVSKTKGGKTERKRMSKRSEDRRRRIHG